MEEYKQWLEQQIERSLNDKDLQREHWAFCNAYEKFIALQQTVVSEQSEQMVEFPTAIEVYNQAKECNNSLWFTKWFKKRFGGN